MIMFRLRTPPSYSRARVKKWPVCLLYFDLIKLAYQERHD
jgi:hypothetical protein